MPIRRRLLPIIAALLIVGGYFLGGRAVPNVAAVAKDAYDNVELFANVLTLVQKNYVDDVSTQQLIEGAITGMLSSLDPHSAYLPPEFYGELQVDTKGSFGGLGIEITVKNGILTVVAPIEDTPAAQAGVKAGDMIIKIDDDFTKDMTLVDAVRRMRGPRGTKVKVTLRREGVPEFINLVLTREVIKIQSVKSRMLEKGYGYLRITQFQERTSNDLEAAIEKQEKEPGGISGLVLDMRNNPGGLLTQAIKVSDLFLDGGLIVYTDGRLDSQKQKYYAHKTGSHVDYPMVILVNGGTASASEIVTGALQDHKRALVLGTQTFGKGSVQTILPLETGPGEGDKEKSAIRLTTARYYTPNGRSIQATGITPDIVMENQIMSAAGGPNESLREENLPGHLDGGKDQQPAPKPEKDDDQSSVQQTPGEPGSDPQLERALELLKSWNVFKTVVAAG
jgi:carboxyl-terminal processing protease